MAKRKAKKPTASEALILEAKSQLDHYEEKVRKLRRIIELAKNKSAMELHILLEENEFYLSAN